VPKKRKQIYSSHLAGRWQKKEISSDYQNRDRKIHNNCLDGHQPIFNIPTRGNL
jgi:hypothetical protein